MPNLSGQYGCQPATLKSSGFPSGLKAETTDTFVTREGEVFLSTGVMQEQAFGLIRLTIHSVRISFHFHHNAKPEC